MIQRQRVLAFVLVIAGAAGPVRAQSNEGLAGLLLRFFSPSNPVVLAPNLQNPAQSHDAHFVSQSNAQDTLRQLNAGIAAQLSTFPIGSSSGGFTFTFDESLGVYNRTTQSFGPIFAERPLTAGKGKFSLAVNYQHGTWDRIDGRELGGGELPLYLVHEDVNRDGSNLNLFFEGDLIASDLAIDLKTDTTVFLANYGLSERLDIGIALPFQRVDLDANITATVDNIATVTTPAPIHFFDDGTASHVYRESGSASGIGDMLVRAKWNLYRGATASAALGTDLRLPTGDEAELLGSGATQFKLYGVVGGSPGRFSPRAGLGYTFSSGGSEFTGDLPDELNYSVGFDLAVHPRFTIAADFVGRTLLDANKLVTVTQTYQFTQRLDPTVRSVQRSSLSTEQSNLGLYLGAVGFKINPAGRLLLVGNLLIAIGDGGLQDSVTPVFGIDYSF
ncbi:MAG TPA: hypothetical protein VIJ10_03475 [Vicinamibacteria bacterium]